MKGLRELRAIASGSAMQKPIAIEITSSHSVMAAPVMV